MSHDASVWACFEVDVRPLRGTENRPPAGCEIGSRQALRYGSGSLRVSL